jgi:hypothetical protein
MPRLIDTSIETRGKKITYDRVTLKKTSQKRQFPKHKDRKQNNKKKKLGKIRLNSRRLKKIVYKTTNHSRFQTRSNLCKLTIAQNQLLIQKYPDHHRNSKSLEVKIGKSFMLDP